MLDPEQPLAVELGEDESAHRARRNQILLNALRAAKELSVRSPQADLAPLAKSLKRLTTGDLPENIRVGAEEVLLKLNHHDR